MNINKLPWQVPAFVFGLLALGLAYGFLQREWFWAVIALYVAFSTDYLIKLCKKKSN